MRLDLGRHEGIALGTHLIDLSIQQLKQVELARDHRLQMARQGPTVPRLQRLEPCSPVGAPRVVVPDTLGEEHTANAEGRAAPAH